MGETPNRPVRNTHYSQPATEERQLYGEIGHIKHWIHVWWPWCVISGQVILSWFIHDMWYSQPAREEHTIAPNRPLRNGWICQHYMGHVKHIKLCKLSRGPRCVIFDHIIQFRCLSYRGNSQPSSEERPNYSQPATEEHCLYGAIGHIKQWKPCLRALMCYFGTNNRF